MEADKTRLRGFSFPWVIAVPNVRKLASFASAFHLGPMLVHGAVVSRSRSSCVGLRRVFVRTPRQPLRRG